MFRLIKMASVYDLTGVTLNAGKIVTNGTNGFNLNNKITDQPSSTEYSFELASPNNGVYIDNIANLRNYSVDGLGNHGLAAFTFSDSAGTLRTASGYSRKSTDTGGFYPNVYYIEVGNYQAAPDNLDTDFAIVVTHVAGATNFPNTQFKAIEIVSSTGMAYLRSHGTGVIQFEGWNATSNSSKPTTVVIPTTNTKVRFNEWSADQFELTTNFNGTAQDNTAIPSWDLKIGGSGGTDNFSIDRAPAGSTTFKNLLILNNAGVLTSTGDAPDANIIIQSVTAGRGCDLKFLDGVYSSYQGLGGTNFFSADAHNMVYSVAGTGQGYSWYTTSGKVASLTSAGDYTTNSVNGIVGNTSQHAGYFTTIALKGTSANTTIAANSATTTWTLTLPSSAGTANQYLQTDGAGNTTWVSGAGGNASQLEGLTWEAPGTIGSTTPNSGVFTNITGNGTFTIQRSGNPVILNGEALSTGNSSFIKLFNNADSNSLFVGVDGVGLANVHPKQGMIMVDGVNNTNLILRNQNTSTDAAIFNMTAGDLNLNGSLITGSNGWVNTGGTGNQPFQYTETLFTVTFGTTAGLVPPIITNNNNFAKAVKVGNMVTIFMNLDLTYGAGGTNTSAMFINNLPFPIKPSTAYTGDSKPNNSIPLSATCIVNGMPSSFIEFQQYESGRIVNDGLNNYTCNGKELFVKLASAGGNGSLITWNNTSGTIFIQVTFSYMV